MYERFWAVLDERKLKELELKLNLYDVLEHDFEGENFQLFSISLRVASAFASLLASYFAKPFLRSIQ